MSYEKTIWANGDLLTAQKMNKIEDGIAAASLMIINSNDAVLDKTFQEIYDAVYSGTVCYTKGYWEEDGNYGLNFQPVIAVTHEDNWYKVYCVDVLFITEDPDDYPYLD